jgi:hypothetical protein
LDIRTPIKIKGMIMNQEKAIINILAIRKKFMTLLNEWNSSPFY